MAENKQKLASWEIAQAEYESAMEEYRHYTNLRRQDMTFVTTAQLAVLTIIGTRLVNLGLADFLLSLIAFFLLLLGINSERRLGAYLVGYKNRASDIEEVYGMKLMQYGAREVKKRRFQISNRIIFPVYYFIFLLAWIVVWIINLV